MKKKLHILFLCGWFPSKVLPTNGDFIQRHADAVATLHDVTVIHIITDATIKKDFIDFSTEKNLTIFIGYVRQTYNPFLKFKRYWKIFKQILNRIETFDVVHLNEIYPFGIFALYLKKKYNIPFIISEHWTGFHYPISQKINLLQKTISKKITKNASFICPVSYDLAKSMQKFGLKGNYKCVPNVVDTNLFKPKLKKLIEFTIIHVSNMLDVHKNISGMLKVAKKLEEKIDSFTWKFVGGEQKNYQNLIDELNYNKANIEFHPHICQKELVSHLQTSTIFVLFSNYENLPCVILESFACGVSVIATNVGGIKEFFPENFGLLIDSKNEEQLLHAILELHRNEKINPEKMHEYAVQHFSPKVIAKQFSILYFNALSTL